MARPEEERITEAEKNVTLQKQLEVRPKALSSSIRSCDPSKNHYTVYLTLKRGRAQSSQQLKQIMWPQKKTLHLSHLKDRYMAESFQQVKHIMWPKKNSLHCLSHLKGSYPLRTWKVFEIFFLEGKCWYTYSIAKACLLMVTIDQKISFSKILETIIRLYFVFSLY